MANAIDALLEGGRIALAIERLRTRMANEEGFADKVKGLDAGQAIDATEHAAYQNAQSRAFASGKLTEGEAMLVYRSLGECWTPSNGGWAKGVDTATKVTITRTIGELLGVDAGPSHPHVSFVPCGKDCRR